MDFSFDPSHLAFPSSNLWYGEGLVPVAMIHTGWNYDATDQYVGLKGGAASSNHGHMDGIHKILSDNPACDYYFHCGDSMVEPKLLSPFISVEGNNDWYYEYPKDRLLNIGGHTIYIFHGTGYTFSQNLMLEKAKSVKADIVFFGHTHIFTDEIYDNIHESFFGTDT